MVEIYLTLSGLLIIILLFHIIIKLIVFDFQRENYWSVAFYLWVLSLVVIQIFSIGGMIQ